MYAPRQLPPEDGTNGKLCVPNTNSRAIMAVFDGIKQGCYVVVLVQETALKLSSQQFRL